MSIEVRCHTTSLQQDDVAKARTQTGTFEIWPTILRELTVEHQV